MSDLERHFQRYLNGELSQSERQEFEAQANQSSQWQDRLETAQQLSFLAQQYSETEVPKWDRGSTFTRDKASWWQVEWMPALSMACSVFAVVLVLFNVRLTGSDQGLLLSYGNHDARLEQRLDDKFQSLVSYQQTALEDITRELKQQQQEQQLQLANYLISTSRQERQEDFTDLIRYVNEQRTQDYELMQTHLNKLQRAVYTPTNPATRMTDMPLQRISQQDTDGEQ